MLHTTSRPTHALLQCLTLNPCHPSLHHCRRHHLSTPGTRDPWRSSSSHATPLHGPLRAAPATPPPSSPPPPPPQLTTVGPALLLALAATGIIITVKLGPDGISTLATTLQDTIASQGPFAGPALFLTAYILSTVLLLPGSVLTLAAGALYGPLQGTVLASVASTAGATASFLIARYLARPWVTEKFLTTAADADSKDTDTITPPAKPASNTKPPLKSPAAIFQRIDKGVAKQGARLVLLLRLSPLIPFSLSNYLYGLTAVPLPSYVGASWLGMLPGTFAYVYLGSAARAAVEAAAAGGGEGGGVSPQMVLFVVGAAATLGATKILADVAGAALSDAEEE